MDNEITNEYHSNAPMLPPHTKQAAKAMALLLFYSVLMFTLPFGAFYGTKHVLQEMYHIDGFTNTAFSVLASVITVNLIICLYVYQAYHEPEYDDEGNEIDQSIAVSSKSDLNLKSD